MKKIVGIIAAVAMATSVFAIDVASMLQLDGNLAGFGKEKVTENGEEVVKSYWKAFELNEWDPQGTSDFVWKFSVSGDNAGATIFNFAPGTNHWVTPGTRTEDGKDVTYDGAAIQNWSLWFKPADFVKITAGYLDYDYGVKPHFGWWASVINREDYGLKTDFTFGALNLSFALAGNYDGIWNSGAVNSYWTSNSYEGLRKLGEFWLAGSYNVDGVGTFGAGVHRGAKVNPHGFAQTQCWGKTPLAINAYYSNQPWGQTGYFADFALVFAEKSQFAEYEWNYKNEKGDGTDSGYGLMLDRLTGQLYGEIHVDALTVYIVDVLELQLSDKYQSSSASGWKHNEKMDLKKFKDGFEIKAQYAIDAYTPYIQIDGYSIMDKKLGVKTAVGFNVGACAVDVGANFALDFNSDVVSACTVTVPFEFTINL